MDLGPELENVEVQAFSKLTPTMTPTEIWLYFRGRLPSDVPQEVFEKGMGCEGDARLILGALGGPEMARIYWLRYPPGEMWGFEVAHAFVIPKDAKEDDIAYGNEFPDKQYTVGFIRQYGQDTTQEVLARRWESF